MKKYMKNKDFIPEAFYNKVELNKIKKENQILIFFLIINLILIPITVKNIGEIKEKSILNKINSYDIKQNKINVNDINIWIENIIKDDIERAYITSDKGEIIVDSLDKINELNLNDSLKITDIIKDDDEKYKLGVSLNE